MDKVPLLTKFTVNQAYKILKVLSVFDLYIFTSG